MTNVETAQYEHLVKLLDYKSTKNTLDHSTNILKSTPGQLFDSYEQTHLTGASTIYRSSVRTQKRIEKLQYMDTNNCNYKYTSNWVVNV